MGVDGWNLNFINVIAVGDWVEVCLGPNSICGGGVYFVHVELFKVQGVQGSQCVTYMHYIYEPLARSFIIILWILIYYIIFYNFGTLRAHICWGSHQSKVSKQSVGDNDMFGEGVTRISLDKLNCDW